MKRTVGKNVAIVQRAYGKIIEALGTEPDREARIALGLLLTFSIVSAEDQDRAEELTRIAR